MKTKFWLVLLLAAFMLGAFANSQSDGAAALEKLEGEFMQAAADHGSQGYMSYYADDAVEVPNGRGFLVGKSEISKTMGQAVSEMLYGKSTPADALHSAVEQSNSALSGSGVP